jgi:hypothetical protein
MKMSHIIEGLLSINCIPYQAYFFLNHILITLKPYFKIFFIEKRNKFTRQSYPLIYL